MLRIAPKAVHRTLALLAVLVFAVQAWRYASFLLDDAYISLRYARNLVDGYGLVFNPGERVEGYTNFLWTLLGALFLWLDPKGDVMAGLQIVSCLAAAAMLVVVHRLERLTREADEPPTPPAVLWLLPLEAFAYWTSTGMETMLYAALFTAAVTLGLHEARTGRARGAVLLFVLLALTRPEGVGVFGLATAAFVVAERLRRGVWAWRRRIVDVAVFGLLYGAYFAWRVAYYGELLPNTFHAKVTGGAEQWINGWINLGQWARTYPLFAVALLAPGVLLAKRFGATRERPELWAIWGITTAYVGYLVSVGGDFMPFLRFYLPVLPLAAVLWTALLRRLALRPSAVLLLWLVHLGAQAFTEEPYRAFVAHRTTVVGSEVGRFLDGLLEPGDLIAVNTAGSLPYAARRPTVDMLGLTDKAIARHPVYITSPRWAGHRRGWGEYVFERRPRVVVWYNSAGLAEPHYLGDHQLADHPFFRFFYQMRRRTLPAAPPEGDVLMHFLGEPFGDGLSPELGTRFVVQASGGIEWSVATSAPITLHSLELRRDREDLLPLVAVADGEVGRFLDRVVEIWRAEQMPPSDPNARREVEALCDQALERLQAGDSASAKELLSEAAGRNEAARSPRVDQYIANLAVLEGDLFLAVQAQQEALRLDPWSALYRKNLEHLLAMPYDEARAGSTARPAREPTPP